METKKCFYYYNSFSSNTSCGHETTITKRQIDVIYNGNCPYCKNKVVFEKDKTIN